jgi:hypothetical protein
MDFFIILLNPNKRFIKSSAIMVLLCLSLSACSGTSNPAQESESKSAPSTKDFVQHIHPATECVDAVVHSHPGGDKEHTHKSSCDGKVRAPTNAHEHPATDKRPAFRHIHPNGANPHTHHK